MNTPLTQEQIKQMLDLARSARQNSYAPYSHFYVGACLLTDDGERFTGCNFENSSLGASICAERCAASCAIAAGHKKFAAIAIVANTRAWPCGICRQVLREFCDPEQMPVFVAAADEDGYVTHTLEELLPESFGPMDFS